MKHSEEPMKPSVGIQATEVKSPNTYRQSGEREIDELWRRWESNTTPFELRMTTSEFSTSAMVLRKSFRLYPIVDDV